MVTFVGTEDDPVEMLQHLIQLDYAAAESYQAAVERLENEQYRQQLATFKADHERHIEELKSVVIQLGSTPPMGPSPKGFITQGKVAMGGLVGDRGILEAMRTNEDDTNTAYERAITKAPPEALEVITRGREDERRHCEWILSTLKML